MQKVLLVEGDPTLREWVRLHLAAQGLTVTAFEDSRRALEAARLEPPDLLLIATDLPFAGAFALAGAIRSNVRTALIPILFLVSANDPVVFAQAISIEPQGVVTKPLTRLVLLDAVAARLGAKEGSELRNTLSAAAQHNTGPTGAAVPAPGVVGSGLLLDARNASVLVVMLRNFVSLARSMNARTLDALLRQFLAAGREAVVDQGGWIVRADATGLVALFEEAPKTDRTHAMRAIEAALGVVLAARRTKQWAESALPNVVVPDLSVGCGVHAGEVIIARLSGSGHLALTIAGQTADLAQRLDGRAKGLGWSVAVSDSAVSLVGSRFQVGRRGSLTDTDHSVTIPISEVLGFNPGTAKPGDLPFMAEVREAVLANTMLATLAGDVDQATADRTIMVTAKRAPEPESVPELPQRRIERKLGQGTYVETFLASNVATDRQEVVKTIRLRALPEAFIERYLEQYRKIASLEQRSVLTIYEVGQSAEVAYVAAEYLPGGSLTEAIRKKLPVGLALNCLAQMCLALDAVHGLGIVHGGLRSEHFMFREDRVLVLADFNVIGRVSGAFGLVQSASDTGGVRRRQEFGDHRPAGPRADFNALGCILHAMLTGDTSLPDGNTRMDSADGLFHSSRLPLPLSPLQPCLDGLLGVGSEEPYERAEDVVVGLLALKDIFPFDIRHADTDRPAQSRNAGRY